MIKIKESNSDDIVVVKGLKKYFPNYKGFFNRIVNYTKAVNGVDFFIKKGEAVGLVGESGSGKSTIGRCIARLYDPTEGSIEFDVDGNMLDITELHRKKMKHVRKHFQMLFQDVYSSLNPKMKVVEIITEPMTIHGIGTGKDRVNTARRLMERVGLSADDITKYPHQFSGGQRQRIGVARALSINPDFIICDEPVSALDVSVQAQILNLLADLQKDFQLSYLFIAHDLGVVRYLSDRVMVMYLGKIMEIASSEDLYDSPIHPYTEALLAAVPKYKLGQDREILLKGSIPDPSNPPTGCVLHPRCDYVKDVCKEVVSVLQPVPGRNEAFVACHRFEELNLRGHGSFE